MVAAAHHGLRRAAGGFVVLLAVSLLSAWSLAPIYRSDPAVAVGYSLLDLSFTLTALLLSTQPGQRGNARLAALLAGSSLMSHLADRDVGPLVEPAMLYGGFTQVLAAALILRYPSESFDLPGRRWVRVNLPLAAAFGLTIALESRPQWVGVATTRWWFAPLESSSGSSALLHARAVWRMLAAAWFLVLVVRRWRRLARLERRTLMPILVAAVYGAVMIAVEPLQYSLSAEAVTVIVRLRSYTGAVVGLAFVVSALQMRLARAGASSLALALTRATTPDEVRDALRQALGDDTLEVYYWVPETGSYVEASGEEVTSPSGPRRTRVAVEDSAGEPLAVLHTDEGLTRHADLLNAVTAVSRLALENNRLQAGLRAQLLEVEQARARLLRSGFAQRRQLERDLHDGAQQRLLAVGMKLAALEVEASGDAVRVDAVRAAKAELHEAMNELRQLAHGIYPAVLTQGGLQVALDAVAERVPLDVKLDVPPERLAPDLEGVIYLVACEAIANAIKHGHANRAIVKVKRYADQLRLEVTDDGSGWRGEPERPDLPELRDRVAAFGGRFEVTSTPVGTTLTASLPNVFVQVDRDG